MGKINQLMGALIVVTVSAVSQSSASAKSLASTMDVYAFPKKGQDTNQQSQDEAACYGWASNNTGSDPFDLQKQAIAQSEAGDKAKQDAAMVGQGAGASGAIRGAAAGVLIGDSHESAAKGAAIGLVASRMKARAARKHAKEKAEKETQVKQAATGEQLSNFKKAFSVCLEAKDYLVKY